MYLNCKTYFSFRYGTYGTEELIKEAVEKGITSLALTNINNTCDAWDFVDYCIENNIKPVIGTEIRNDEKFSYVSAWEWSNISSEPILHPEKLHFEFIKPSSFHFDSFKSLLEDFHRSSASTKLSDSVC